MIHLQFNKSEWFKFQGVPYIYHGWLHLFETLELPHVYEGRSSLILKVQVINIKEIGPVTHIAGPIINMQDRIIQRCAVCGELLVDTKDQITLADALEAIKVGIWAPLSMVRIDNGRSVRVDLPPDELPDDACIRTLD